MRPTRFAIASALFLIPLSFAHADGCGKERKLNGAENGFIADRVAAAKAAFPAPPAGWVVYAPEVGVQSRVGTQDFPPNTVCDDFAPRPLSFFVHATYTPKDSALMRDLANQREELAHTKQREELGKKIQAASTAGDYNAVTQYMQQMQALSGPVGSTKAAPMSEEEYDRRNAELQKKLDAAQAKNDYAAAQALAGQQMKLIMLRSGVDTSGAEARAVTTDQINTAPRVHVVVSYNENSYEFPKDGKKINFGGAAQGWTHHMDGWCFDGGGPKEKQEAVLLFGPWTGSNDFNNELAYYNAPTVDSTKSFTKTVTTKVTVCGDQGAVEKLLPGIKYERVKP